MSSPASRDDVLPARLLRAARAWLGISQRELAQAAGVSVSTVSEYERGARQPIRANQIVMRDALTKMGMQTIEWTP